MTRGVSAAVAALVVVFWTTRIVLPSRIYSGQVFDLHNLFYPHYEAAYAWIAAGRLPLWTPYELLGAPWSAVPSGGVFYPPHVLYLLLPTHLALAASGLLHLVVIALSTAWFARRAGLDATPAALAGILVVMRGAIPGELYLAPCRLEAEAWLPLGCIAVLDLVRAAERGHMRDATHAGAVLAFATALSCLAGYPQSTVFLGYAWTSLLMALLIGRRASPTRWASSGAIFAGALALGALVALVALLPALELSRAGARTTKTLPVAQMFPMGNPSVAILRDALSGRSNSFGVVGLSLLPAALLARRHRLIAVWALVLGGLAFLLALGPVTPVFELYLRLPALGWFRGPYRLLVVADFCFAILAAAGLAGITAAFEAARHASASGARGGSRQRSWARATIVLPAAVALVLSMQRGVHADDLSVGPGLAACVAAVLLGAALLPAAAPIRGGLALVMVVVATLEAFLAPANPARLPYFAADAAEYRTYETLFRTLADLAGHDRVWMLGAGLVPRTAERLATIYEFRSFTSLSSATLARQANYYTYLSEGSTHSARPMWVFQGDIDLSHTYAGRAQAVDRRRLVDLAAVRFVVTRKGGGRLQGPARNFITTAGYRPTSIAAGELAVFENPRALPRAYVAYNVRAAPAVEKLLGRLSRDDFDPLVETYVEGSPGFVPATAPARGTAATIVRDDPRVVEIDATLEAPGLVVLADTYYDGWRATVDGNPAPILPTNHLFRGVPVPAGFHRVRFDYLPWSFIGGAAGSVVASLALAAVFAWARRSDRWPSDMRPEHDAEPS